MEIIYIFFRDCVWPSYFQQTVQDASVVLFQCFFY